MSRNDMDLVRHLNRVALKAGFVTVVKKDGRDTLKSVLDKNFSADDCEEFYAKGLRTLPNDDLFLMTQHDNPADLMTKTAGLNQQIGFKKALSKVLSERQETLIKDLNALADNNKGDIALNYIIISREYQKSILDFLFMRELNLDRNYYYQNPKHNQIEETLSDAIQNLPKQIMEYLSEKNAEEKKEKYKQLMQSHAEEILKVAPSAAGSAAAAAAAAASSSSNQTTPRSPSAKKTLELSSTLTGNATDAIDSEIIGAVLGNPTLGTKEFVLPQASGEPATITVYGGMIRFEYNQITKSESLATDHGEANFINQIDALITAMKNNGAQPVSVDFVVAEASRNHFSTLSVTIDPSTKQINIAHRDTKHSDLEKLPENSLQKKLEAKITDAIKEHFQNEEEFNLEEDFSLEKYNHVGTTHQQKADTCADRVMLSMLLTHDSERLEKLLENPPIEFPEKAETIEAKVDYLLNPDNEALLRQFTCFLVKQTPALKDKVAIVERFSPVEASFLQGYDTWYKKTNDAAETVPTLEDRKEWLKASLIALNTNKRIFGEGAAQFAWKGDSNTQSDEPSVQFNDAQKSATISLTMSRQNKNPIDITLIRKEEEIQINNTPTPVVTWRCDAEGLSEKEKFKLIAAESLALRKAQGLRDANKIGIVELDQTIRGNQDVMISTEFKFSSRESGQQKLSPKEVDLIKAHLNAGYNEVTYRGITFTGTKEPALASVVVEHFNPSDSKKPVEQKPLTPRFS